MLHPLTSRQWSARVGLVVALAASEVVIAGTAGVGGWRLVALAALAVVFVLAYLVSPSAGKPEYEPYAVRPVAAMTVASVAAIGITGGIVSPLLPLLLGPYVLAWTMVRPRRVHVLAGSLPVIALIAMWLATREVSGVVPARPTLIGAWSLVLALLLVGRRVGQLFETLRAIDGCLARVRRGALDDAASRRRGLESLTTKLAHELKNPLAAIKSLVQVEVHHATDDKARRRLDVVLTETERLRTILGEYLELARPAEELELQPVELAALIAEVTALLGGRAEAAGVTLAIGGTGGEICADRRRIREAIVNLISNSLEATPRGGSVTVSYELAGQVATITVSDTGSGMTPDVANRVGTPFFTTRHDGTGLGVAIARTAIVQHHGRLDFTSAPGRGTTATVALPAAPEVQS